MQKIANISLFESVANRSGNTGLKWGYQEVDPSSEQSYGTFSDMDDEDITETMKFYLGRTAKGLMTMPQAVKCLTTVYGISPARIKAFLQFDRRRAVADQSKTNMTRLNSTPSNYVPPPSKLQRMVADEQRNLNSFTTPGQQPTTKKPFFGKLKSLLRAAANR